MFQEMDEFLDELDCLTGHAKSSCHLINRKTLRAAMPDSKPNPAREK
jgi:hypothetical protein